MWIQTLYHEMGHFLFWTDAERKADAFQRRMVLGLRAQPPSAKAVARSKRRLPRGSAGGAHRASERRIASARDSARAARLSALRCGT